MFGEERRAGGKVQKQAVKLVKNMVRIIILKCTIIHPW